jgi:PAS domain S-box-containing protein
MMEPNGAVLYYNKKTLEFMGKTQEEAIMGGWQSIIHPEDLPLAKERLMHAIEHRQFFEMECRAKHADGHYRWILTNNAPRFSPEEEFIGFVGSGVDITETKLAQDELKTYAFKLEQSNRELEQFATIASHDLQAPLRKVMMFSDTLKASTAGILPEECNDYINRMQKATVKMQNLITDLLVLSRVNRKGQPFHRTSLQQAVQEAMNALEFTIADCAGKIELGHMIELDADPGQLHQLLQNLIENALKFHKKGVPPVVKVDSRLLRNGFCEITVSDNGIGFNERFLDRIFKVFERLHGEDEYIGTGIGLAICHKIVERHAGTITAKSIPGQGAQFIVTLPVQQI